ncbi:hypothetical protein ACFC0D_33840 [Streptomyces sp. NPDC056222]|uniref:hypothetical protein n=1 Tax=Streptomyces sp. NPDC056222 TaxID=3345749 RepID=UPI0035E2BCED
MPVLKLRDEATILSDWLERLQMTDLSRTVDDPAAWAPIRRVAGRLGKSSHVQVSRFLGRAQMGLALSDLRELGGTPQSAGW